ncbi:malto-oligosyltrehalose synthase [Paracoccus sp. T5]|uniref:malto-oligosyltrehalose synthase n=1 Tax=Paracoccus sp. T5 TaxID=3402161 RepID=UPI003AED88F7
MIPTIPTATYRVQLREGFDFARLEAQLDYIAGLGASHLYLSPIFQATEGSTHGYDITDPSQIEPALGGSEGFERLAAAAKARNLGIILDIVPNHTALTPQNPWLWDVLQHGRASKYARHFDIDWHAGPLVLPFLAEPFEKMLTDGAFRVAEGKWWVGEMALPLAPGTDRTDDLRSLHDAQNWRLVHYEMERDSITHRRFFNVTGLIGMRVEDPRVFDDTHALILRLVRSGQVQGLRVDHIDGLADPAAYMTRLSEALPDTPIWVEKILVGDEALPPAWQTVGTTGYEAGRLIARMLTPQTGMHALDGVWREATGMEEDFHDALSRAKAEVLDNELAAERRQLVRLAVAASSGSALAEAGPESLREAVTALLIATPRYRSYVDSHGAGDEDRALISEIADQAAQGLRSDAALRMLAAIWMNPTTWEEHAFVTRLQQVSGALLAKAQEDTAGFRWTRYLPANEVGAEPDEASVTGAEASRNMAGRRASDMVLTSSHDTKRSEDSRMRMVAISHLPQAFATLHEAALALPEAEAVEPRWRWYVLQSALGLHGAEEAAERLTAHMEKAMREAKLTSFWTAPDEAAEKAASAFGVAVLAAWDQDAPEALTAVLSRAEGLMMAQLLFKVAMPGFPDIYRGTEDLFLALTDPDNRRPIDFQALARLPDVDSLGGRKARWTRRLLSLRQEHADFLRDAGSEVRIDDKGVVLTRELEGRRLVAQIDYSDRSADLGSEAVLDWASADGCRVRLLQD